jgi:predicted anti-sigma-YlaC factor YlaD
VIDDALHRDLGVYVLGGLEPADRDRFERHLATCDACREELARLAVLPQLLSRLQEAPPLEDEAAASAQPVLRRIAEARRRTRRLTLVLAGTALASLLLAAVLAVSSVSRPADGTLDPSGVVFVAAEGESSARLESRDWGMTARITPGHLAEDLGYSAWAVTATGHRTQLASWASADGDVAVVGSCYLQPADVAMVEIVGANSDEVVAVLEPRT